MLDVASEDWKGSKGYIDENVIKKIFVCDKNSSICPFLIPPQPSSDLGESTLVMVCGPPGMMAHICGEKGPKGDQGDPFVLLHGNSVSSMISQGELRGLLRDLSYVKTQVVKL